MVPTLVVLSFGVARQLPGHVRAEAKRLTWQLGQKVSIARVEHLRPGVVLYEGLELSDPEGGGRILRCRTLEARWGSFRNQKGQRRDYLALIASEPEIEADRLGHLWQLACEALTGRSDCRDLDLRLEAAEATLRQGDTWQKLTGLAGKIERLPGGSRADLTFRLDGIETPEPVQIHIARNHQTQPPATGLGVRTGGGTLPCSFLALGVPELAGFGSQSQFCGYVWAYETPEGWGGEIEGRFTHVDLERLVDRRFPHTLRGTAVLKVQKALFAQGRLQNATGSLVAGPGVISRSLLEAAADRLGMARGREPQPSDRLVVYDRLVLSFLIDARGLQLRGESSRGGPGAILVSRDGILLGEPTFQPVPLASVVQTLIPSGPAQVPATRSAGWLLRRLPLADGLTPRVARTQ